MFDPHGTGESAGSLRRWKRGARKVGDLRAALAYLAPVPGINPARLNLLGLCQGASWAIAVALEDATVQSLALVAGHYRTPEVCAMYYGSAEAVAARVARGQAAASAFARDGSVSYLPTVNDSAGEAGAAVSRYLDFCNSCRLHSSLDGRPSNQANFDQKSIRMAA